MEKLYRDGRVRAIGVSNFHPDHLRALIDTADVVPTVNQVELHPYLQQRELRAANDRLGIATEAWSPLAQGGELLRTRSSRASPRSTAVPPAQVVLRWHLQLGTIVIPKSVTPSRIEENFDVFDFELDDEDMAAVAGLDRDTAPARTRTRS